MKNRKSISYHNLISSEISAPPFEDFKTHRKTKPHSLEFLKKSSKLVQSYKAVFSKPSIYNFGDADRTFRESLRNYDSFDPSNIFGHLKTLKGCNSAANLKSQRRSPFSNVNKQKSRFKPNKEIEKASEKKQEPSEAECVSVYHPCEKHEEEDELEVFYSPNSEFELFFSDDNSAEGLEPVSQDNEDTGDYNGSEIEYRVVDDELQEVEDLVQQAESAMNDVVAENEMLQETTFGSNIEEYHDEKTVFSDDSVQQQASVRGDFTEYTPNDTDEDTLVAEDVKGYDPSIDAVVIKELEDAEQQAMDTAKIIFDLKQRVAQLLSKDKMTEAEARELEEKNKQLKEQMILFEARTKRIQFLIDKASLSENIVSSTPRVTANHNENITENDMSKIIVPDDKMKPSFPAQMSVLPQFAKQLCESYSMQEKLAAENADLEDKRYKLQEDLLNKDCAVDGLQRKLQALQTELRLVCKENCLLSERINRIESSSNEPTQQHSPEPSEKMPVGGNKEPRPADIEARLQEYSDSTQQLEKQLCQMELEVRDMKSELVAVQKERQSHKMLAGSPSPCHMGFGSPAVEQQLRELREQYNRLQDDYKGKLTEVAGLRADTEKLKQNAKVAEEAKKLAEDKVKEYERDVKSFRSEHTKLIGSKEQVIEQEQQLNVAKQRFRDAQEEVEELRALIQDHQAQLDDYRNKYLQAQQQVEEQRRQIDLMEMENNRISEHVNLEIQRVKNQFQEKIQELTPLPDILMATQLKLKEAQQMHLLAERSNENLIHELQAHKDKAAAMADQMEKVLSDQQLGVDEKIGLQQKQQQLELKISQTEEDGYRLQKELVRAEEIADQKEKRVQEKLHEIAQLVAQLETVREESARQVARTKDRCETVRRSMQNQIADLERQLAQSRAQARSAQKDRDDIRQKMQAQINTLNENFEDAQMRIINLQGHVNFLKNSYTTVFPNENGNGIVSCDCGNAF